MEPIIIVSSILLWVVVLFNLLLTVALIRRDVAKRSSLDMENVPTLEIGSQAPDFTAETLDGKTITLHDYDGKSVAFIFFSPSCKPCLDKMLELHELAPYAHRSGVDLILVNTSDALNKDELRTFIEKLNITLPVLMAPRNTNPFMDNYMVAGTPFYCAVEENGKVQSSGYWGLDWYTLTQKWTGVKAPFTNLEIEEVYG